jgi:hypothetical protein
MRRVEDYREHAEECRSLAKRCRSTVHRDMLLNMAQTWEVLASNRETQIAQQRRMAEIAAGPGGEHPEDKSILNAANDD